MAHSGRALNMLRERSKAGSLPVRICLAEPRSLSASCFMDILSASLILAPLKSFPPSVDTWQKMSTWLRCRMLAQPTLALTSG